MLQFYLPLGACSIHRRHEQPHNLDTGAVLHSQSSYCRPPYEPLERGKLFKTYSNSIQRQNICLVECFTFPQARQWCLLNVIVNSAVQDWHIVTLESAIQTGAYCDRRHTIPLNLYGQNLGLLLHILNDTYHFPNFSKFPFNVLSSAGPFLDIILDGEIQCL